MGATLVVVRHQLCQDTQNLHQKGAPSYNALLSGRLVSAGSLSFIFLNVADFKGIRTSLHFR